MYWGLVFLAVSLLSLPFALYQPLGGGGAATVLVSVFGGLSLIAFAADRLPVRRRAAPPRDSLRR